MYYYLLILHYLIIYFEITFLPVIANLHFHQSLLQSSVSHEDPSEIIVMLIWSSRKMYYYYQFAKQLYCLICFGKTFKSLGKVCF